jgi:ferredoxin
MKILIDKEKCVGCAACVNMYPDVFELKDGKAKVKKIPEDKKIAHGAVDICPVGAIKVED